MTKTITVWERCAKGEGYEDLLAGQAKMQKDIINSFVDYFYAKFDSRCRDVKIIFDDRPQTNDRKELMKYFHKFPPQYIRTLWAMVDGKDWHVTLWESIKPTA